MTAPSGLGLFPTQAAAEQAMARLQTQINEQAARRAPSKAKARKFME
jgi:hypothetical protein